jgi:hypothetical protein
VLTRRGSALRARLGEVARELELRDDEARRYRVAFFEGGG